jgi:hypothetical protein
LTEQHRVVLRSTAKNVNQSSNFLLATDERVEQPSARFVGYVGAKPLQGAEFLLLATHTALLLLLHRLHLLLHLAHHRNLRLLFLSRSVRRRRFVRSDQRRHALRSRNKA